MPELLVTTKDNTSSVVAYLLYSYPIMKQVNLFCTVWLLNFVIQESKETVTVEL